MKEKHRVSKRIEIDKIRDLGRELETARERINITDNEYRKIYAENIKLKEIVAALIKYSGLSEPDVTSGKITYTWR